MRKLGKDGFQGESYSQNSFSPPTQEMDMSISGLHAKHQQDLENLTVTSQPLKTIKLFILAIILYLRKTVAYLLSHGGWLMLFSIIFFIAGALLVTVDGPHEKHFEEVLRYLQFGFWWMALGVASSIGLGSGLHTFVLYLGPHIAFFTIKAVQCGRVDIKSAPYDTIQMKYGPSWLGKNCSEFGPSMFSSPDGIRVPLSSILPQVQLEAVLWGLGTALGELPPYFISRAACMSGGSVDAIKELNASSLIEDNGFMTTRLNQMKNWFLSHAHKMNFFSILVLASVPNPLFDFAGIICGQFGIPFWEFFLATMIGKAIIKTHIQTLLIILVCNNQLLDWIENELIWVLTLVPGFNSILPNIIAKLHSMKDNYLSTKLHAPSTIEAKKWDFSLAFIWNTVVWFVLMSFFVRIVNATAQGYLKKEQDMETATLQTKLSQPSDDSSHSS